jgi:hypothetical protein
MPRVQLTHLCAGLLVSAVGLALVLSSPANAERVHKKQGSYHSQRVAANANARRVKPQDSSAVYWGCCTKMGADPIRSSARRFCAMRAVSSVESTRRVPHPWPTVSAASPIEGDGSDLKGQGASHPRANVRERTACA